MFVLLFLVIVVTISTKFARVPNFDLFYASFGTATEKRIFESPINPKNSIAPLHFM